MSIPFDLTKVDYTSMANSFKNDNFIYTGTMTFPTSIASGSFVTVTQSFDIGESPQFSMLYAYFQEYLDTSEEYFGGVSFRPQEWYSISINSKVGMLVTAPAPQAGPLDAIIYPVINGTTVTVTGLVNNPYSVGITLEALEVPWAFVIYTLAN